MLRGSQRQILRFGYGLLTVLAMLLVLASMPDIARSLDAGVTQQAAQVAMDASGQPGHGYDEDGFAHLAGCASHASCSAVAVIAPGNGAVDFLHTSQPGLDIYYVPSGRMSTPHAKPPIV